jgi:Cu+-exporting ATPase
MTAGPDTQAPPSELQQTQLVVGGMTCASCSARVEKKLGKLTGVTAAVNYATGKRSSHPGGLAVADLVAAVEPLVTR